MSTIGVVSDGHMKHLCRSSFYHLNTLSRIQKYLMKKSAAIAVHAFVTSKLDYCNSLLFGLFKYQLKKLQYLQNTAARIVTVIGKFEHITPVLLDFCWLLVHYHIMFKILLLACNH